MNAKYQCRIYQRARRDFGWQVRNNDVFASPFASGDAESRAEALKAIRAACNERELQGRTPWRPVRDA